MTWFSVAVRLLNLLCTRSGACALTAMVPRTSRTDGCTYYSSRTAAPPRPRRWPAHCSSGPPVAAAQVFVERLTLCAPARRGRAARAEARQSPRCGRCESVSLPSAVAARAGRERCAHQIQDLCRNCAGSLDRRAALRSRWRYVLPLRGLRRSACLRRRLQRPEAQISTPAKMRLAGPRSMATPVQRAWPRSQVQRSART